MKMEISTIITLIFVIGIVWGGLGFFMFKAMKFENMKRTNGEK